MQLDYLAGRRVSEVRKMSGGGWRAKFEGGAVLEHHDSDSEVPTEIKGLGLQRVVMSNEITRVSFGSKGNPEAVQIVLSPMLYAISDPGYTSGELVWPQKGGVEETPSVPVADAQEPSEEPTDHA